MEEYGLYWLEDVTAHGRFPGLARVTDALSTPIATGSTTTGSVPFRHLLEALEDIVMIDLVRVGGITQWLKVAGMAEAFNLPVVNPLIPEAHVHLSGDPERPDGGVYAEPVSPVRGDTSH